MDLLRGKRLRRPLGICTKTAANPVTVVFDRLDIRIVFVEAHQFETDGVDQGKPTGLDDVLRNPYGGPAALAIDHSISTRTRAAVLLLSSTRTSSVNSTLAMAG